MVKIDIQTTSAKTKELPQMFPGLKSFQKYLTIHMTEFFDAPLYRFISFTWFLAAIIVPWYLLQNYYHLVEPTILSNKNKWTIILLITLVCGQWIFWNLFFLFIHKMKFKWVEKFKGHEESWPWEKNPELWNRQLRRMLKFSLLNTFIISPILVLGDVLLDGVIYLYTVEELPSFTTF